MSKEYPELLPCPVPWCGAQLSDEDFWALAHVRCIKCPECGARGPSKPSHEEAIAAWNTRHRIDGQEEMRKALRQIVEQSDRYEAPENDDWHAGYVAGLDDGARLARAALHTPEEKA